AAEVLHIGVQVIVAACVLQGLLPAVTAHAPQSIGQQLVRPIGDPVGGVGIGRAAVRRVVFEAAVARRVVAGADDDAVGPAGVGGRAAAVVNQDRVGDRRRGRVAGLGVDKCADVVARQHLQRSVEGGVEQRGGVAAD